MSSSINLKYQKTSFLNKSNSAFIEEMYFRFIKKDPNLPDSWKRYFETLDDDVQSVIKEIEGNRRQIRKYAKNYKNPKKSRNVKRAERRRRSRLTEEYLVDNGEQRKLYPEANFCRTRGAGLND